MIEDTIPRYLRDKAIKSKNETYRLTCIDVFGNKHIITTITKEFGNLYLLEELAGMKIPHGKKAER